MITVEGPSSDQIERVLASLREQAKTRVNSILAGIGSGAVTVIQKGYETQVYNQVGGVFGQQQAAGKPLSQAVQFELSDEKVSIFTTKKEAGYVEFGTGIFATIGPKTPIKPKRSKYLAFPVWRLPSGFKGFFIDRADSSSRDLPFGAIGVVLAKQVKGMKPRSVWFNPVVEKAINKIIDVEIKRAGL